MADGAVIDTDVLMKVSAYRMAHELFELLAPLGNPSALGLTHLIVAKQLVGARKRLADVDGALGELGRLLANLAKIEPSDAEVALAAEIEEAALASALPFDRGESQLAAVLLQRDLPLFLTSDKRAISCLEQVLAAVGRPGGCAERVACLEQFLAAVASRQGSPAVRVRVCAEPNMDTALRLCCGCGRAVFDDAAIEDGLKSYVRHVRETSFGVLFAGDLSTLA